MNIIKPEQVADEKEAMAYFKKDVDVTLLFEILHRSVYKNGDDQPHLVYEVEKAGIAVPADVSEEKEIFDDDYVESESFPLPLFEGIHENADPGSMIGLSSGLVKVREADIGDGRKKIVWRDKDEQELDKADKSLNSWFEGRLHNVIGTIHNKESGKLEGVMSFIDEKGPNTVSEEECEKIAIRFLFALFPNADQYFKIKYDKQGEEGSSAGFTFDVHCNGVPLRFGQVKICVSRQTGRITVYMGPDIDPEVLKAVDPVPSISPEQAKSIFWRYFKVELGWEREYGEDEENSYRLVYKPVYPRLIDAHTGEAVISAL